MSGSDKVYIPEWMPERRQDFMVTCDEVPTPHSYAICCCTANHKNPNPVPSWTSHDPLTRWADSIVYAFSTGQYGDLHVDENFAKAVLDVKNRIKASQATKQLKQCHTLACRCGKKIEIETFGWGPGEHGESWMCPDCKKRYMELCERQIDESGT
jgi:hypothetical protein